MSLTKENEKPYGKCAPSFSDVDVDLRSISWTFDAYGYAKRRSNHGKRKDVKAHRIVLSRILGRQPLPTEIADHINGNRLDNRRENIRLSDNHKNPQNRKGDGLFRGTTLLSSGKWRSAVVTRRNGIQKYHQCGEFSCRALAAMAAMSKRMELEFAS